MAQNTLEAQSDKRLTSVLQAGIERIYLGVEPVDGRVSPFEISTPLRLKTSVRIECPEGFLAQAPSPLTPKLDSRFVTCKDNWEAQDRVLKLQFECRQEAGKFKAEDYSVFRQSMLQALSLLEREVVFAPTR